MPLFGRKKDPYSGGRALLRRLDGTRIAYAAERRADGPEKILGKGGAVVATEEKLSLLVAGRVVFSCPAGQVKCSELQSGDGAIFEGIDLDTGEMRTVVAYFTSPIRRPR